MHRWWAWALLALVLPIGAVHLSAIQPPAAPAVLHSPPLGLGRGLSPLLPHAGGGSGKLTVATADPMAMPNSGLQTNITAFSALPLSPGTSFQVAAAETIGAYDAVFGIFENEHLLPTAFFYVFSNLTDMPVHTSYWNSTAFPLIAGDPYDFTLVAVNSTTWELTVNGLEFNQSAPSAFFDFGTGTSTWLGGLLFSEIAFFAGASPVPSEVNVPLAVGVRTSAGWYLPNAATSQFSVTGVAPWGVEGRSQHPTLAPGELNTGTSIPPVPNGTTVWTGGQVQVRVQLSLAQSSAVATTALPVTVVVVTIGGAPIPGVSLFIGDQLGATSLAYPLVTNGTGGVLDELLLVNVSRPTTDLVRAVVTSFGYSGTAGQSIQVTPPAQVFLTTAGLPAAAAPSSTVTFSVQASDANGAPFGGLLVTLQSPFPGSTVSPGLALSATDGTISVQWTMPPTSTPVRLWVNVTTGGAWGNASFSLDVRAPSVSFWSQNGGRIVAGAAIGLVVLAVAVVMWKKRPWKRKPLPPASSVRWDSPVGVPREHPTAPVSRTPPSGGNP